MATDTALKVQQAIVDLVAPEKDATSTDIAKLMFGVKEWQPLKHPADAAANTAYEIPIGKTLFATHIDVVQILPAAALTGHASDNATITLEYDDAAGGANVVVATITTTANWTAQTPVSLAITAANAKIAASKQLIMKVAKNGSGVALPALTFYVRGLPAA